MLDKQHEDFITHCKELFNTKSGKLVLANLKEAYVDTSAMCESSDMTFYRLGQKELILSLIQHVDSKELNIDIKY